MLNELIEELNAKSIQLTYIKGKLKYSGPEQHLTSELLSKLKENRENLIKFLWPFEDSNLIPISLKGTKTTFILVHGSNSVNFLSKYFDGERPVLNYLDLGSNGERLHAKTIEELALKYIDQLSKLVPDGKYIFCGFSFGGLLAFKMAEIIQKRDSSKVPCIIMFDSRTPNTKELLNLNLVVNKFKSSIFQLLRKIILKRLKYLEYKLFLFFKKGQVIPLKHRNKYILSFYRKLAKNYNLPRLDIDILLFRSMDSNIKDPMLGWSNYVNTVELMELEGDHLGILFLEKNYTLISERINSFLQSRNL